MKPFPIPVHTDLTALGPGTQDGEGGGFSYLPIPRDVPTFSMPMLPENAEAAAMAGAHELLARFVAAMGDGEARMDLIDADPAALEVLNETLGEGEVAVRIAAGFNGTAEVRIQETVFAGVWRERHVGADGVLQHDYLYAGGVPPITLELARRSASANLPPLPALPPGAMNAPHLLSEIRNAVATWQPARPAHVVNLTLLPLTPEDIALIDQVVPVGPVAILSRGFGNCRITSTGVRHLWRVQYFNSMQTLILNTLEIVGVPEVALAAAEDLVDSRERLGELLDWMAESAAA